MDNFTPEQKKKLGEWVVQRDAIITSIAQKRDEEKVLIDSVNNLCRTQSEVHDEIRKSEGRLEELKKKEAEFGTLITAENAVLREEKSRLQTEISAHEKEIAPLKDQKEALLEDVANLTLIHDKVFEKVNGLESLIGGIVRIASENATEVKNILIAAGAELQKVIDAGERNVDKTNRLVLDIPKIIVDLHRDILERRVIARNRVASNGVELKEK